MSVQLSNAIFRPSSVITNNIAFLVQIIGEKVHHAPPSHYKQSLDYHNPPIPYLLCAYNDNQYTAKFHSGPRYDLAYGEPRKAR